VGLPSKKWSADGRKTKDTEKEAPLPSWKISESSLGERVPVPVLSIGLFQILDLEGNGGELHLSGSVNE